MKELSPIQLFLVVGASSVLWPLVYIAMAYLRFSDPVLEPSPLVFAPMGAVAGGFLAYWLQSSVSQPQRTLVTVGYLVACPLAFIGALFAGLIFHPVVGTLLFGAVPLIIGTFFGYFLGRRLGAD